MKQVLHTETTPVPGLTRLSLFLSPLALPLSLLPVLFPFCLLLLNTFNEGTLEWGENGEWQHNA